MKMGWEKLGFGILLSISLACRLTYIAPTSPVETAQVQVSPASGQLFPSLTAALPTQTSTLAEPEQAVGSIGIPEGQLSAGDPYAPELGNSGYDVQQYSIELSLDPANTWLGGRVTIQARSTLAGLHAISLDFSGFHIQSVTVTGIPANYERREKKLIIALPRLLELGKLFTVQVTYQGTPPQESSPYIPFLSHLGMFFQPESKRLFVASEPDGAHTWFPCNDHPRDKATYQFELAVPHGLVGIAIGKLTGVRRDVQGMFPDGQVADVYSWQINEPAASAFVTVAVGDYEELKETSPGGVLLRSYIFPEKIAEFSQKVDQIGKMVDWMAGLYGDYPYEAFGYVMVEGLGASLETQTMVVMDKEASASEETLVHEMAHMWFGDWVSLDSWGEIWRSEGFATYTAALWENRADPGGLETALGAYQKMIEEHPLDFWLDNPPPEKLFDQGIYFKGALLAHALRQEMGDESFFEGLRTYFKQYGGGNASQAQFQQVMEQAAGISLGPFFSEWITLP